MYSSPGQEVLYQHVKVYFDYINTISQFTIQIVPNTLSPSTDDNMCILVIHSFYLYKIALNI